MTFCESTNDSRPSLKKCLRLRIFLERYHPTKMKALYEPKKRKISGLPTQSDHTQKSALQMKHTIARSEGKRQYSESQEINRGGSKKEEEDTDYTVTFEPRLPRHPAACGR
ncbi:hypothetical protein QAD02_015848 [Eretmocerus hayati]|uniref:Uncharacterized protein n=1 Tax=Eretmocerus hayati TaxID=131215 RepID=A0ACC2P9E1_9HYME|nr:hypothetical protein QAD02_015848 [Eretmocerus hayati]